MLLQFCDKYPSLAGSRISSFMQSIQRRLFFIGQCLNKNFFCTGSAGTALNLKQFMLQRRVIKLYRDLFRITKSIPDECTRKELRDWIRTDFRKHKTETDEYAIKMLILHGERALKELQTNIHLSQ